MALEMVSAPVSARRSADDRLRVLVDVQQALVSAAEPRAAGRVVVEQVLGLVDGTGAALGVIEGAELVFHSASGVLAEYASLRLATEPQPQPGSLLAGRIVRSADLQRDAQSPLAIWRGSGARGAVAVPIGRGRALSGLLIVVTDRAEQLAESEVDLLRLVAGTLGLLLENAQPSDDLERSDAFRCSAVPLALLDLDGRIVRVSDATCEVFGYSPQELQLSGVEALLAPEERVEDQEAVRQVLQCERRSVSRLARMRTRRGEELAVVAGARLVRERSGRVVGLLRSFCDVGPELARVERRCRSVSTAAVARVAASTSQSLNGRLGVVLSALGGIGETLRAAPSPHDAVSVRELTREALHAAREMQSWLHELRLLAIADERKRKEIDVRQALDAAAGLTVEELRARVRLLRDYREVPGVDAVEPHMVQLFAQLLLETVNSLPPSATGASELRLSTWTEEGRAVVEISDRSGAGRTAGVEPSRRQGQAVRLGMPLLHGLVEAMGGVLDVQTEGTERRMRVEFPGVDGRV